jgi:single stranded DNA-binding protein
MASVASITLLGNLGKDPVLTKGSDVSKSYCDLSIAVEIYDGKDAAGKGQYKTNWWNPRVFGQQAEYIAGAAKKGNAVLVLGDLVINEKDGKQYNNVRATTVRLATRNEKGSGDQAQPQGEQTQQTSSAPVAQQASAPATAAALPPATVHATTMEAVDEDLPF